MSSFQSVMLGAITSYICNKCTFTEPMHLKTSLKGEEKDIYFKADLECTFTVK